MSGYFEPELHPARVAMHHFHIFERNTELVRDHLGKGRLVALAVAV